MAYAVLVSLSQTISQILSHHQYQISLHQQEQITSIHKHIVVLQTFLEDFPDKSSSSLEGRIRDVANEAEDVTESLMSRQKRSPGASIEPNTEPDIVHEIAEQIESISGEVMEIMNQFSAFKDVRTADSRVDNSSRIVAPSYEKEAMVGFDDHLLAIKERLCGEPSKLQVIPIVGMGGIGKTTLARNAFHHPLMMEHFDIHAWVTVSQDYSAQEILSSLLDSMKVKSERCDQDNELKVHQTLKSRRYLIVMDDMWGTEAWDDVRRILPDDNNGSRIILTTRQEDVAAYADPSRGLHEIHLMDADQSWNLLRHRVFKQELCPVELEDTGKEIAGSCKGLPLAIVVIAGLLSTVSKTRASWEEIAENVKSTIATENGQLEKILSLSYTHLPHRLRPCFLYMGTFPEDYDIRISNLVKLWVAEGFLKCPNGTKSSEEAAEEYLEDLVKRSLVLVTKRKSNGKIKSCSIHDLVRDLCIKRSEQEKFFHLVDNYAGEKILPRSIKDQRRIRFTYSLDCLEDIYGSSIRTITCFKRRGYLLLHRVNLRLLRILNLVDSDIILLSDDFFEPLFHLRYLSFGLGCRVSIPAAISKLQNLETLIIHSVSSERDPGLQPCLPTEIWRMPRLRHLVCFFLQLPDPQGASSALVNLQTVYLPRNLVCTKQLLEVIPNLKKLGIFYERRYRDDTDYELNNLVHLKQLEKLKLVSRTGFPWRTMLKPAFPETLKKLSLSRLGLPWEDMTVIGSLPNLQVLKLRNFAFQGYKWETVEGEFPELKYLLIDLSNLYEWITKSSHFPRLKSLLLHRTSLKEIPDGIAEIPTLELIEIKGTNESLVKSAKQIQEQQEEDGNDVLQFRFLT